MVECNFRKEIYEEEAIINPFIKPKKKFVYYKCLIGSSSYTGRNEICSEEKCILQKILKRFEWN